MLDRVQYLSQSLCSVDHRSWFERMYWPSEAVRCCRGAKGLLLASNEIKLLNKQGRVHFHHHHHYRAFNPLRDPQHPPTKSTAECRVMSSVAWFKAVSPPSKWMCVHSPLQTDEIGKLFDCPEREREQFFFSEQRKTSNQHQAASSSQKFTLWMSLFLFHCNATVVRCLHTLTVN